MAWRAVLLVAVVLLQYVSSCVGMQSNCAVVSAVGQYRKDYSLPYSLYPTYNKVDPTAGGRVHLVVTSPVELGELTSVQVNGEEALNLSTSSPDMTYFDWARAMYDSTTKQVSLSFHSRNTAWLDAPGAVLHLVITGSTGCAAASWTVAVSPVWFTWIAPKSSASNEWIAHLHNNASAPANVTALLFDGVSVATRPSLPFSIRAGAHLVLVFNASHPKQRGGLFTIAASTSAGTVGNGARVPDTQLPMEVWPHSTDCPVPGVNQSNWESLITHGLDTVYYSKDNFNKSCGVDLVATIEKLATQMTQGTEARFFVDSKAAAMNMSSGALGLISAVMLADEDDGQIDATMRQTLSAALAVQDTHPGLLTYQGGKTSRNDGAYAGVCDIQGMDYYVAACAPTITFTIAPVFLEGAYAFARNTRNNQQPLMTLTYAQLYSAAWNTQPNGPAIAIQTAFTIAAGSKGVMMFQSFQQWFDADSSAWNGVIQSVLLSIASPRVRHVIRTGDVAGMELHSSDPGSEIHNSSSVTEVIRNDDSVLVVVINTDAGGYSGLLCHVGVDDHWTVNDHTVQTISLGLTEDTVVTAADVASMQEVVGGEFMPPQSGASATLSDEDAQVVLTNVALSAKTPVRMFMFNYTLL